MNKMSLGSKGLESVRKRYRVLHKRNYQEKGKLNDTESVNTFSRIEPACIATFKTIEQADEHMDIGHHIITPEKETVYNNVCRQRAAVTTSVKGTGQKIGRTDYACGELTIEQRMGLKEAESCGENIFGCQRIFDKFIQQGS